MIKGYFIDKSIEEIEKSIARKQEYLRSLEKRHNKNIEEILSPLKNRKYETLEDMLNSSKIEASVEYFLNREKTRYEGIFTEEAKYLQNLFRDLESVSYEKIKYRSDEIKDRLRMEYLGL